MKEQVEAPAIFADHYRQEVAEILSALLAGRSPLVTARLRDELESHYESILNEALSYGKCVDSAHEKAINDMGWTFTRKVLRLLDSFDQKQAQKLRALFFERMQLSYPRGSDPVNIRMFGFISMFAGLWHVAQAEFGTGAAWLMASALFMGLYLDDRRQYQGDKINPLRPSSIAFKLSRHVASRFAFCLMCAIIIASTVLDMGSIGIWLGALLLLAIYGWIAMPHVFTFARAWNRYYPDDRIF